MMKHFISTILPTMLLCMSGAKAYAYDIAVDNADGVTIYYNIINDDKELEVTYHYDYNDYMHNFDWYGFEDDYVGSVVIPEEVTYSDVTRKVTKIGNSAFAFCIKLTSVTIPNGVTAIGSSAFERCYILTSVTIPNSVTSIGEGAFEYCESLPSIVIPDGVTFIGNHAFWECSSMTSITIPNSVTTIEFGAFYHCSALTSITIPDGVTSIGSNTFSGCSSLTSITIPNGVTSIGEAAFSSCTGLTSITIPNTVTSMERAVFANMDLEYVVSQIEDPFALDDDWFFPTFSSSTYENAILYVPAGTIDKYKATIGWNKFAHIEEGSPTGMKASERKGANELKRYDLSGRAAKNSSRGVNIIHMDDGTTKKILVK